MRQSSRFYALLLALRPRQWTKNGIIFVGLVFAQQLFVPSSFERALIAFFTFCLLSSSTYILNDLYDLEQDRQHPVKRLRPLASGRLPLRWAIGAIGVLVLLALVCMIIPFFLPVHTSLYAPIGGANVLFVLTMVSYLCLMALYSMYLKHIVLLDVFVIAAGFVLRIVAGTVIIPVVISPWLYLVTCFLSLFLALSKRRHEIILLQEQAGGHRRILKEYSVPMLDQMITVVVTGTLLAYSLYTFEGPTGNQRLMITIPFVLYGMFRYLYLMYMRMEGGSPEEVLLRDRHILGTVVLCIVVIISVLYLWHF